VTVLDLDVPVRVWALITVTTTSSGAESECERVLVPFTGVELLRAVLGLTGGTVGVCLAGAVPIPVTVNRVGAVLLNAAGRCGVVVGDGVVVQPAGRRWALATTNPSWWVTAWWPAGMVATVTP